MPANSVAYWRSSLVGTAWRGLPPARKYTAQAAFSGETCRKYACKAASLRLVDVVSSSSAYRRAKSRIVDLLLRGICFCGGLRFFVAIFRLETARQQALLAQPAHHDGGGAMRDDHALRAGGSNRLHQSWPVGVVRQHKTPVHATPTARTAQQHPAAGKRIAIVAEAPHPRRTGSRGRRDDDGVPQSSFIHLVHHHGRRQGHAAIAVHRVQGLHGAVADDGAD